MEMMIKRKKRIRPFELDLVELLVNSELGHYLEK